MIKVIAILTTKGEVSFRTERVEVSFDNAVENALSDIRTYMAFLSQNTEWQDIMIHVFKEKED